MCNVLCIRLEGEPPSPPNKNQCTVEPRNVDSLKSGHLANLESGHFVAYHDQLALHDAVCTSVIWTAIFLANDSTIIILSFLNATAVLIASVSTFQAAIKLKGT